MGLNDRGKVTTFTLYHLTEVTVGTVMEAKAADFLCDKGVSPLSSSERSSGMRNSE